MKVQADRDADMPDDSKRGLGSELGRIVALLGAHDLSPDDLRDMLAVLVDGAHSAGGADPLGQLRAAVAVAEAADLLTHFYARQAHDAGFSWQAIGEAAGYRSAQAAHWRWSKHAKDFTGLAGPLTEDGAATTAGAESDRTTGRPLSPQAEGWMTATQLGRRLGVDPRTVRSMASRGELEVFERPRGADGRRRDLYRS